MYDFVKLYVIPIAFVLLAVWLEQGGTDFFDAAVVCGLMHGAAQVTLYTLKDIYDNWLGGRCERHPEAERPARHKDITLDDLNALLERIDRGGDDAPDTPLLTTNEERRLIGYAQRLSYAGDEVIVEPVPVYSTSHADDVAYTVTPEPGAAVSGVTQNRR